MFESAATEIGTAPSVFDQVRSERAAADAAEARLLQLACDWADLHSAESIHDAAMLIRGGDSGVAIAGEGAPLVSEFEGDLPHVRGQVSTLMSDLDGKGFTLDLLNVILTFYSTRVTYAVAAV